MSTAPDPAAAPVDTAGRIHAALQAHAAQLRPGADAQLARLWQDDFTGTNPGLIPDLVRQRLSDPQYGHFLSAGAPPPTPQEQARLNGARAYDQLRTIVAGARAQGPGLAGTFPKR